MAAPAPSPSGFSYAQAAKGRPQPPPQSQTPSSKVTSGAATPATGQFSELAPGSNWADDVETTVAEKDSKAAPAKDSTPEPAKADEKKSGASAPVTDTDSVAITNDVLPTKETETPPMTNGTRAETPSDTKSQSSEPAWIAERNQRQNSHNDAETSAKNEKKGKDVSVSPAPKLLDAPLPSVNPWMKRMEDNKAKAAAQPVVPKTAPSQVPAQDSSRENQKPKAEPKKKSAPSGGASRAENSLGTSVDSSKQADIQSKRPSEGRVNRRQESDTAPEYSRPTGQPRSNPSPAPPPSVQDEVSWPTPESVAEKDRKDVSNKDQTDKQTDEAPSAAKQRKPEWKAMPVTPNYIFETQNIRGQNPVRGGERGGRGGPRGRNGVSRGAANVNGGDRSARGNQDDAAGARGRSGATDREVMGPPPKPVRASSAGSWNDQNKEPKPVERSIRGQSVADGRPPKKGSATPDTGRQFDAVAVPLPDAKRNKAAKHAADNEAKMSESVPDVLPRRNSVGTQTDDANNVAIEASKPQPSTNDVRKESRMENTNRETNGPTRGGKRNGRGRGGARELANGHHAAEFASYGVPPSPSVSGRGNHQFSFVQQGRGGYIRGNPRSQSIPYEAAYYGRVASPYSAHSQLPPVQTYIPGMYEYPGYPMTAVPYQPYMEQQYLMDMVSTQLEYYFSIDNLLKDLFLRKNMDSQGFVFLDVIANFNRIKQLTQDKDLLRAVCMNSTTIEIRVGEDQKERLRRRDDWNQFVLPVDQREVGAQSEGPKQLNRPERPQVQTYGAMPFRGPSSAAPQLQQRGDRRSYDAGLAMMNGFPPQFGFPPMADGYYGDAANMEASRGRTAKSPMNEKFMSMPPASGLQEEKDGEADAFPDDQASTLTVVVKVNKPQRVPYHNAASRTFSNGSIDSRSIVSEMGKKPTEGAVPAPNGEAAVNGTERGVSPTKSTNGQDTEISLFWMKDQNLPSEGLPTDVTLEPYEALRLKALDQRGQAATGTCPYDMDVLYQFWCHFLIRNFNSRMYGEFKYFAHEDAKERHNLAGLQNLVKFYAQALLSHNATRDRLVRDYVDLVKAEPAQLENAAFKQLRSAWRNGALNLKNRKKLNDMIDLSLKERLES